MPNIEIKARCADAGEARLRATALAGGAMAVVQRQVDTYFRCRRGNHRRLKLREIRDPDDFVQTAQLIPYHRPEAPDGTRRSEYVLLPVVDPDLTKSLLSEVCGFDSVVQKDREIWLVGNVRVHLDHVEGLSPGTFLELEAVFDDPREEEDQRARVLHLMQELGVQPDQLVAGSYRELLIDERLRKHCPELHRTWAGGGKEVSHVVRVDEGIRLEPLD